MEGPPTLHVNGIPVLSDNHHDHKSLPRAAAGEIVTCSEAPARVAAIWGGIRAGLPKVVSRRSRTIRHTQRIVSAALSCNQALQIRRHLHVSVMSNNVALSDVQRYAQRHCRCRFSFMAGLALNQPSRPRSFHSIGGLGSCSISGLVLSGCRSGPLPCRLLPCVRSVPAGSAQHA